MESLFSTCRSLLASYKQSTKSSRLDLSPFCIYSIRMMARFLDYFLSRHFFRSQFGDARAVRLSQVFGSVYNPRPASAFFHSPVRQLCGFIVWMFAPLGIYYRQSKWFLLILLFI